MSARARRVGRYLLLAGAAGAVLLPVYVAVVNSLLPPGELLRYPPKLLVTHPRWSNYAAAFNRASVGRYLLNSFVVAGGITVAQVVTSVLAAYAFAWLRFPLRDKLFLVFLATLMVPWEATIVANHATIRSLGWIDSYQALIVPFLATAFGTFLLRQTFLAVPRDLRDAARLDGYGHLGFVFRVAVPVARPAIGALALLSFLTAWNQYLWPLLVTNRDRYRTVQIGLKALSTKDVDQLGIVFAGTIIASVPVFVLLLVFQRQLLRGLTAGAVKG